MQRIDSSICFAITTGNKSLEQVKFENKCVVGIPVGMQGIIKTQEKHVQLNYPGDINMPMFYDLRPCYQAP